MRFLLTILFMGSVLSCPAQNLAAPNSNVSSLTVSPVVIQAEGPVRMPGERMRNTGRALTIAGIPLLLGGIIVLSNANETYYQSYSGSQGSYSEGDPQAAIGWLMITGGAGMSVPGIILWSKGSKRVKRHKEREGIEVRYSGPAVHLQYRF